MKAIVRETCGPAGRAPTARRPDSNNHPRHSTRSGAPYQAAQQHVSIAQLRIEFLIPSSRYPA